MYVAYVLFHSILFHFLLLWQWNIAYIYVWLRWQIKNNTKKIIITDRTGFLRHYSVSPEAARFRITLFQSLWNLTGPSEAALPRCLWNFRAIQSSYHPISQLRVFMRFGGKTSYCLVNRGLVFMYYCRIYCVCSYLLEIVTHSSTVTSQPLGSSQGKLHD